MKNIISKILAIAIIIIALLALAYNLWQSHRHSPDSMKRDAEEHVMKLLTKLYENDKKSVRKLILGDYFVLFEPDCYQLWFDCNPHWNPNEVSITRSEIEPSDSSFVNVYVRHNKQASLFRVHMSYQTFTSSHAAIPISFLDLDEKRKGLNVPLKPKYTFPLNQCMDDYNNYFSIIDAEKASNAVNKLLKSLKNQKTCKYYYPGIGDFYKYLPIDSTTLKVRNIVLINQKFNIHGYTTFKYEVYCSDSLYFIYDLGKEKIVNSYGFYDYNKRLKELSKIEDYPSFNDLRSSLNERESDLQIISQIKKIRSDIDKRIQEQRERKHIEERVNHYKRVGLAIEEMKMVQGKDRDGDITKGFSCSFFNPTDKTIKYIIFHLWAINGVGDSMGYPRTFRGIGPIEPGEYGTFSDDNMFVDVNNVIDDISVNIEVQYTDGTKKNVKLKEALATIDFNKEWWNIHN